MDPDLLSILMGTSSLVPGTSEAILAERRAQELGLPPAQGYGDVAPIPQPPQVTSSPFDSRNWGIGLPQVSAMPPTTPPVPAPGLPPIPTSPAQEAYRSVPMPAPVEDYRTAPYTAPTNNQPASLGASLEPPMPRPRPTGTGANPTGYDTNPWSAGGILGPNAGAGGGRTSAEKSAMLSALKGVVPPQAPQAQKVSTPHAPPMAKMTGGNVAELLAALGIGPQQAFPGLKLPSTLGQALGR